MVCRKVDCEPLCTIVNGVGVVEVNGEHTIVNIVEELICRLSGLDVEADSDEIDSIHYIFEVEYIGPTSVGDFHSKYNLFDVVKDKREVYIFPCNKDAREYLDELASSEGEPLSNNVTKINDYSDRRVVKSNKGKTGKVINFPGR